MTAPEDALTGDALTAWRIYHATHSCTCGASKPEEQEHDTGCRIEHESDVPCLTDDDVAEMKLQARDYDGWAAL